MIRYTDVLLILTEVIYCWCMLPSWQIINWLSLKDQNFDINLENICTSFIDGFADIVNVHASLKILSRRQQKQK